MDQTAYWLTDMEVNEDDYIVLKLRSAYMPGPIKGYLLAISNQQSEGDVIGWELDYTPNSFDNAWTDISYHGNIVFLSYNVHYPSYWKTFATKVDLVSGEGWSKTIQQNNSVNLNYVPTEIDENGDYYFIDNFMFSYPDSLHVSGLFKLDENGNTLWRKGLRFETFPNDLGFEKIIAGSSNDLYLLGGGGDFNTGDFRSYLYKFDQDGNFVSGWKFPNHSIGRMVLASDGIYLLDKGLFEPFWNIEFKPESATLIKLDHDLNLLWAKEYRAENFPYAGADIAKLDNGGLVISHTTTGTFPTIFSKLDSEGNIINQKGYPNFRPNMKVLSDGSLLLASRHTFDANGETTFQPLIAKTDPDGHIDGCETLPTCLYVEETTVTMEPFGVEFLDILDLEDHDVTIKPVLFTFSDYCNFPPAPTPDFQFPDTLCLADSATTTATNNRLANAHEWHLTGPGTDSVNTDSFDFSFRFLNAGEYNLKHTVWVLGCSYEFEKNISVLPDMEVEIAPLHLCPNEPQEIIATSNYPNVHYLWNTGDESEAIHVVISATYSVEADIGGRCVATDTADVFLVADLLGFENPVQLSADTILCDYDLPFLLNIESEYSDVFLINNDSVFNDEYILNKSGEYLISTEIEGCYFSKTFNLETSDCKTDIYLPNIFSPNNDGINDEFFPQGNDFEMISLKVFDRWGGLRYSGIGSGAKWVPGKAVAEGAYVYLLVYKNTLTREVGQVSGDVVLVR